MNQLPTLLTLKAKLTFSYYGRIVETSWPGDLIVCILETPQPELKYKLDKTVSS